MPLFSSPGVYACGKGANRSYSNFLVAPFTGPNGEGLWRSDQPHRRHAAPRVCPSPDPLFSPYVNTGTQTHTRMPFHKAMNLSPFEERVRTTGAAIGISVDVLRPAISKILDAIRTSGFFQTYTDHSMAHCDQMFSILGWLIPPPVQASLTEVEHALLTVAVYLHDLGMLATKDEFDNRSSNEAYRRFEQSYLQSYDPSTRKDADHSTPEHFIFEEYIRHTHAQRIFDWITGGPLAKSVQGEELSAILHTTE